MRKRNTMPEVIAAALRRDPEALRAVIAAGANVDETDHDGRTALHHAAINGDVDTTRVLLEAGARSNTSDATGRTPLHFAAGGYHLTVAEVLLKAGVAVDSEDAHGNTPLFRAVFESRGRGEMIRLLRQHGADISHKNRHGVSPDSLAATIANYDVAKWLR